MNEPKHNLEILEEKLKRHDWYYQYSDDHSAWKRGCRQAEEIQNIMENLKQNDFGQQAKDLYNKYLNNK
jgi:hypothetical protein